jgi:hypothetical protein
VRIVGICLSIETNSQEGKFPLPVLLYSTAEGNILLFHGRILSFFGGIFAEQEKTPSTIGEGYSTAGNVDGEGILGNFD